MSLVKITVEDSIDTVLDKMLTIHKSVYGKQPKAFVLGKEEHEELLTFFNDLVLYKEPKISNVTQYRGIDVVKAKAKSCLAVDVSDMGVETYAKGYNLLVTRRYMSREGTA